MLKFLVICCLVAVATASKVNTRNELTCEICVDIVTDIDNFITSETTEQELVEFVEQICVTLGSVISGFESICKAFIEAQLPAIIEGIVQENLNPTEVCTSLTLCP